MIPPETVVGVVSRSAADQHLEAIEAVGALPVGRTPRQSEAEPGERQRGKVGQHVGCVGQQRERSGDDPARHLGKHEAAGDERGKSHAPLIVGVRGRVSLRSRTVAVTVTMRV
jgi:hypothetical protein